MTTKIGYLSLAMFLDKCLSKRSDSQIQMMDSSRQLDFFFNLITAIDTCMIGNYPYSIADGCAAICEKFPSIVRASLIAQLVRNLPAMQETLVQFLGQEDPMGKG